MKLKTETIEGKGTFAVVQDGKPVYVHDDGKEVAFDAAQTVATISRLNGEAKSHRERAELAETNLKKFDGIEDADAAKKALSVVKNLDAKKLVDAGEIDKVKTEAIKAVEEKYAPIVQENERLKGDLYSEKIGGSFSRSKFISEKVAIPADMLQARFGKNFEVKDGKIVAKDISGNPIYSRAKPGELAEFEEAIETLVESYPQKDHILKGNTNSGDGKRHASGNGNGPDLSKLSPVERINQARSQKGAA
jgi:hypothetical protein